MNAVLIALTILYPFLVYATLGTLQPRVIALGLAILLLARFFARPRDNTEAALVALTACVFAIVVAVLNSMTTLLFYPAMVNLSLLALFGYSLWRPPTVIERIARLTRPDLPASGVAYTRKVTWVWCGFFVANATAAAWTAVYGSLEVWTLYNGLLAYLAIATVFLIEWLIRRRVQAS